MRRHEARIQWNSAVARIETQRAFYKVISAILGLSGAACLLGVAGPFLLSRRARPSDLGEADRLTRHGSVPGCSKLAPESATDEDEEV